MWLVVDTSSEDPEDGIGESRLIRSESVTQIKVELVYETLDLHDGGTLIVQKNQDGKPNVTVYRVFVKSGDEWFKLVEIDNDDKSGSHENPVMRLTSIYQSLGIDTQSIRDARHTYDLDGKPRKPLVRLPFLPKE
ncbi:MAG: hypothetical protein ACLQVD_18005 [Capsulimonadaceae bacterium]